MRIWQKEEGGWPVIEWIEEYPTWKTVGYLEKEIALKGAFVVGLFFAALVYFGYGSPFIAVITGMIVMGIIFSNGKSIEGLSLPGLYRRHP